MFGNGVPTGIVQVIMDKARREILRELQVVNTGFFAAVPVAASLATAEQQIAAGASRTAGTTTLGFV